MIEEIRQFIGTCPLFSNNRINVNYLGDKPAMYSIDSVPANLVVKEYADGGQLCQQLFVLASRELYTKSLSENIAVTRFYEEFSDWVDRCNQERELPRLGARCTAQSIEVLTGQYLFDTGDADARYQIQCRLIYYKEA